MKYFPAIFGGFILGLLTMSASHFITAPTEYQIMEKHSNKTLCKSANDYCYKVIRLRPKGGSDD